MFFFERVLRRGERDFWRLGLEGKVGVLLVVVWRFDPRSWVVVMSMKFWPFWGMLVSGRKDGRGWMYPAQFPFLLLSHPLCLAWGELNQKALIFYGVDNNLVGLVLFYESGIDSCN